MYAEASEPLSQPIVEKDQLQLIKNSSKPSKMDQTPKAFLPNYFLPLLGVVLGLVLSVFAYLQNITIAWWQHPIQLVIFGGAYLYWIKSTIRRMDYPEFFFSELRVEKAQLKEKSGLKLVNSSEIKIGQKVFIASGDLIPRDGRIVEGTTSVDVSRLLGKTKPILKKIDDKVVGGSLNRDSDITIVIENDWQKDRLEKVIALQKESLDNKPEFLKRSSALSLKLTLASVFLAIIVSGISFFLFNQNLVVSLTQVLSILFLVPITYSTLAYWQCRKLFHDFFKERILVKEFHYIDRVPKIQTVFFNKTGTLTKGEYHYSQLFIEKGSNMGEFLTALFSLESQSSHPIAEAMPTHPWYNEIKLKSVQKFEEHKGLGVCGLVDMRSEKPVFAAVGNLRFMKRQRFYVSKDMRTKIEELEEVGDTAILCGFDKQVKGVVSFSDILRKRVRESIKQLQKMGMESVLITGDTEKAVTYLTGNLGIKKIYSRCTEQEKALKLKKEKDSGQKVAMVGRDTDNASAFHEADLSIAFATGIYFHNHKTDVLILGRNPKSISTLFQKSRHALSKRLSYLLSFSILAFLSAALGAANLSVPFIQIILALFLHRSFLHSTLKA